MLRLQTRTTTPILALVHPADPRVFGGFTRHRHAFSLSALRTVVKLRAVLDRRTLLLVELGYGGHV